MTGQGVQRLVVQSSYGVGESRDRLPLSSRLVFTLLLRPQIADHERQERIVRDSGLTWSLVQPVYLTDGDEPAALSDTGDVAGMRVSRRAVGEVLAELAEAAGDSGRCVAVSGAAAGAGGGPAGASRSPRGVPAVARPEPARRAEEGGPLQDPAAGPRAVGSRGSF
jgi:hypothetical protein